MFNRLKKAREKRTMAAAAAVAVTHRDADAIALPIPANFELDATLQRAVMAIEEGERTPNTTIAMDPRKEEWMCTVL